MDEIHHLPHKTHITIVKDNIAWLEFLQNHHGVECFTGLEGMQRDLGVLTS